MSFESSIVFLFQHVVLSREWLTHIAVFCARYLPGVLIILALWMAFSKHPKQRHAAFEAVWSVILALLFTTAIGALVQRVRPFLAVQSIHTFHALIPPPLNTSFPSGHTGFSFAIASALFYANRRIGMIAYVIALVIGVSRVAVGVHYPSDILGGIGVGIGSFLLVRFLHGKIRTPDLNRSTQRHHHS